MSNDYTESDKINGFPYRFTPTFEENSLDELNVVYGEGNFDNSSLKMAGKKFMRNLPRREGLNNDLLCGFNPGTNGKELYHSALEFRTALGNFAFLFPYREDMREGREVEVYGDGEIDPHMLSRVVHGLAFEMRVMEAENGRQNSSESLSAQA